MIILGIDPGTKRIGYGVLEKQGSSLSLLGAGIFKIDSKNHNEGLLEIRNEFRKLSDTFKPDLLAIEKLYFVKNQKTGLQVAEARGVIILSAGEKNMPVKEYAPNEVKSKVAGYGLADKKAVLKMVKLILQKPDLNIIDDASDALALAIAASKDVL